MSLYGTKLDESKQKVKKCSLYLFLQILGNKFNRTINGSCCYSNDPIHVRLPPLFNPCNNQKKNFSRILILGFFTVFTLHGFAADTTVVSAVAVATPVSTLSPNDKVGPFSLRDDTSAQVLDLLQKWTGKTVLRPQALPPNLYTLNLPAGTTRSEALLALETLLNLNGISVIQQGDRFLKVVPNNIAKSESPSLITESTLTLPASGRVASKIFILKHANGQEVVAQIASMLNATLATPPVYFGRNNAILVTDSIMNLQKIETLLNQLDRPQLDVVATKMYNLKHAIATDVVTKLTALLRSPAQTAGAPFRLSTGTTFTADERTNRIILIGSADQHPFFDNLIETLDANSDPNTMTDVIFLRHANATEVATLLTQLITGQTKATTTASGGKSTTGANRVTTPNANVAPAATASTASSTQNGADEFSSMTTVLADVRSNSVVVSGTKDDLRLLHQLIDKVDVVLPQVRVEVVIAEVTLTDADTSGISALGMNVTNGKLVGVSGTFGGGGTLVNGTLAGNGSAFATLAKGNDLTGVISLSTTPTKNDTRILSVPTITTTHNKEATIFVGESRPVITGTQSTAGSSGLVSSSTVSQRDIGIQLKVLPLIGKDGSVQLQVTQQVEDILGQVSLDGNSQPIIGRRSTDSFVSAMSGEIIVLGGLQRTQSLDESNRLGPIPFIGDLLGSSTKSKTRTELIIFMRPYVLNNSAVDNLSAINRINATPISEDVKKVINPPPAEPVTK